MRKLALLVGLFALGIAGRAEAVPQTVSFTGRLSTMSGPVTGSVNLTFKLYDAATGGTAVWTEVRNGVGANNGLVFVDLGQVTTLDSTLFTGARMYLEVTVGAEVLSPRMAINSVPYAMQTDNSQTLGGSITAADVITSAAGSTGVTATKTGNALAVSLVTAGCTSGQAFKYNGTGFACANDANSPPVAGAGIAVSGNTVSLATTGCSTGYVWKYNGTAWACALDADTTYAAGAGIVIAGNSIGLSTSGCAAGYVWKYTGTAWGCALDANTTYTAGAGITISGTSVAVATGGITSAMIGTAQVGMDEINTPLGSQSSSATSVAGSNYIYSTGAAFTAATSGNCFVTSYIEATPSVSPPSGYAYTYPMVRNLTGGTNTASGNSAYIGPNAGTTNFAAQSTYTLPVTAGNSYSVGCYVFVSSGGSFVGRSFSCTATYLCI